MTGDRHTPGDTGSRLDAGQYVPAWLLGVVLALLLAVAGVGAYVVSQATAPDRGLEEPASTVETWAEVVKANPNDVDARVSLGFALQTERRWAEAVEAYSAALDSDPEHLAALYNRGVSLLALGRRDEAERDLRKVLDLAPAHVLAAKALGELLVDDDRYDELAAVVQPASEAHPELADLRALLGLAYEKTGDPEAALEQYRAALQSDPDLVTAKTGLWRLEEETSGD